MVSFYQKDTMATTYIVKADKLYAGVEIESHSKRESDDISGQTGFNYDGSLAINQASCAHGTYFSERPVVNVTKR